MLVLISDSLLSLLAVLAAIASALVDILAVLVRITSSLGNAAHKALAVVLAPMGNFTLRNLLNSCTREKVPVSVVAAVCSFHPISSLKEAILAALTSLLPSFPSAVESLRVLTQKLVMPLKLIPILYLLCYLPIIWAQSHAALYNEGNTKAMTNSIVARFYGEQVKMTKFIVILNNCLSFTIKSDIPMTAEQFHDKFEQDFGTPGMAIVNEQKVTLSNGMSVKDLIFSSEALVNIQVFPLGTLN
jgi:hypothetical protein